MAVPKNKVSLSFSKIRKFFNLQNKFNRSYLFDFPLYLTMKKSSEFFVKQKYNNNILYKRKKICGLFNLRQRNLVRVKIEIHKKKLMLEKTLNKLLISEQKQNFFSRYFQKVFNSTFEYNKKVYEFDLIVLKVKLKKLEIIQLIFKARPKFLLS